MNHRSNGEQKGKSLGQMAHMLPSTQHVISMTDGGAGCLCTEEEQSPVQKGKPHGFFHLLAYAK
jgi:hypothetical protein